MKNLPITLIMLLACASTHAATPAPAAPETDAAALLVVGAVMALLSTCRRRRTQLFR